jgi:CheY-like chemotaxis protein/HPt (histidine-containing phosphotransfer) domain-containing protein
MTNLNTVSGIEKSPCILVADDNEVNQKIAQLILQKAGYRVDVAENGQQAVEACQQNYYDLILMDIQMPLMDGHEATRAIRAWEVGIRNSECGKENSEVGMRKSETENRGLNTDVRRQMTDDREQKTEAGSGNVAVAMLNKFGKDSDPNSETHNPKSAIDSRNPDLNSQSSELDSRVSNIQHPVSSRQYPVPILAMTGSAADGSFNERLYPGMNGCIGKPLQRDLLLSAAQKWIPAESKTQTNENPGGETRLKEKRSGENQLPLDLDRAIQEFMGEKEILYGVLQKFVTSAGYQIDNIHQSVQGVDYDEIGSEAHAIKGAAANLTADKLAGLASDLEQAAKKQQPDLIAKLAGKLEREFFNLENYIQQLPDV